MIGITKQEGQALIGLGYLGGLGSRCPGTWRLGIAISLMILIQSYVTRSLKEEPQPGYTHVVSVQTQKLLNESAIYNCQGSITSDLIFELGQVFGKGKSRAWSPGIPADMADSLIRHISKQGQRIENSGLEQVRYFGVKFMSDSKSKKSQNLVIESVTQARPGCISVTNSAIQTLRALDMSENNTENESMPVIGLRSKVVLKRKMLTRDLPSMTMPSMVVYRQRLVLKKGFNKFEITFSWSGRNDTETETAMLTFEPKISLRIVTSSITQQIETSDPVTLAADLASIVFSMLKSCGLKSNLRMETVEDSSPLATCRPKLRPPPVKVSKPASSSIPKIAELWVCPDNSTKWSVRNVASLVQETGVPKKWIPIVAAKIPDILLSDYDPKHGQFYLMLLEKEGARKTCSHRVIAGIPAYFDHLYHGEIGATVIRVSYDFKNLPVLLPLALLEMILHDSATYCQSPSGTIDSMWSMWPEVTQTQVRSAIRQAYQLLDEVNKEPQVDDTSEIDDEAFGFDDASDSDSAFSNDSNVLSEDNVSDEDEDLEDAEDDSDENSEDEVEDDMDDEEDNDESDNEVDDIF